MTSSLPDTTSCPDRLQLQRWTDGDEALEGAEDLLAHVATCARCQAVVAELEESRAQVAAILDDEDRASSDESGRTLVMVRDRLATAVTMVSGTPAPQRRPATRRAWWQWATAAAVLVGVVLAGIAILDQQPVKASADSVISESQVRGRAWRTQPGKIRQEVYDLYTQDAGKPAVHQRQVAVFSTIEGAERTTTHVFDASGALVNATWRRTDGWGARFDTRKGPHLTLDPPTSDIEALLATLTGEDAEALRYWNSLRLWQVRPLEQAASQAKALSGGAAAFIRSIGILQGPPEFHVDRSGYRIVFTVQPNRPDRDGALLAIEDTFASASLMHESRVVRRVTRAGAVLGTSGRNLISRGDTESATLDRLMAEVDAPPPHWRVTRTTLEETMTEARRIWKIMKPVQPAQDRSGAPSAPESTTR